MLMVDKLDAIEPRDFILLRISPELFFLPESLSLIINNIL